MTNGLYAIPGASSYSRRLVAAIRSRDFLRITETLMGPVEAQARNSHLLGPKRLLVEAAVAISLDRGVFPMPVAIFANFDLEAIRHAAFIDTDIDDDARQRAMAYCRRIAITGPECDESAVDQHLIFMALVERALIQAA